MTRVMLGTHNPSYNPICKKCGHTPGVHTTTSCANYYKLNTAAACDCTGWERDEKWPPKEAVQQ